MPDYVKQADGTLGPTPELIADRIHRYLHRLGLGFEEGIPTLSATPLEAIIDGGFTARVIYKPHEDPDLRMPTSTFCFYAHLRTALILQARKTQGEYGPSVVVRDPMLLMNDLMNDEEAPKLMRCDVLVVLATAFPYYAAAQQHIGNLLRMRQGLGLCSIFAQPDSYELLDRPEKATDKEFVEFMRDPSAVGNIVLWDKDIPKLIKRLNGAEVPGYVEPKAKKR